MPHVQSLDVDRGTIGIPPTLQALMPKRAWDAELEQQIEDLPLITAATPRADLPALIALKAGLHLLNESLAASHAHAQEIEDDATGCYWHGIMHRMEGDFSNANYWFPYGRRSSPRCSGSGTVRGLGAEQHDPERSATGRT